MYQGLLEITGTLDITQFWPDGGSDADTANLKVDVVGGEFTFKPSATEPARKTRVYEGALASSKYGPTSVISNGKVRIRLQGIDAPELHLGVDAVIPKSLQTKKQRTKFLEINHKYRQPLGETAAIRFRDFLAQAGQQQIDCRVRTAVDKPGQAIDSNGRIVGDIYVTIGGQEVHLNRWLVAQGWAFPLFYNSMSEVEITRLREAAQQAAGSGVWKQWKKTNKVNKFDMAIRYPSGRVQPDPQEEKGPVIMPKLFRRVVPWKINKQAKMLVGGFWDSLKSKNEQCWLVPSFLADPHSAPTHYICEYVNKSGTVKTRPDELVFKEEDSTLKDANKKPITTWW